MTNATLIKVDRNGTKHFSGMIKCDRCGGLGLFATGTVNGKPRITPVDEGVCHKCWGTGKIAATWKEYTPDYEAELLAKRTKRQEQKKADRMAKLLEQYPEGCIYIVLSKTYCLADELKAAGAKWKPEFGWYFKTAVEGCDLAAISLDKAFCEDGTPWSVHCDAARKEYAEKQRAAKEAANANKQYLGSIGERLRNIHVTLDRSISFETTDFYGKIIDSYIHLMHDDNGNIIVWKTNSKLGYDVDSSSWKKVNEGESFTITATVKEHKVFNGAKQTVVTRAKCTK